MSKYEFLFHSSYLGSFGFAECLDVCLSTALETFSPLSFWKRSPRVLCFLLVGVLGWPQCFQGFGSVGYLSLLITLYFPVVFCDFFFWSPWLWNFIWVVLSVQTGSASSVWVPETSLHFSLAPAWASGFVGCMDSGCRTVWMNADSGKKF